MGSLHRKPVSKRLVVDVTQCGHLAQEVSVDDVRGVLAELRALEGDQGYIYSSHDHSIT